MTTAPAKTWWTAAEIAEACLPDMPTTKRRVNDLARRHGWASQPGKVRRRKGRGGGLEYHVSLFPTRAKVALSKMHGLHDPAPETPRRSRDQAWAEFDKLKAKVKETAEMRLTALREVDALERAGMTRTEAVRAVARQTGKSEKTLWNWLALVEGIAPEDWLPYLAPASGKGRKTQTPLDDAFLDLVKTYFLTKSQPPLTAAYDWAEEVAQKEGIPGAPHHCRDRARTCAGLPAQRRSCAEPVFSAPDSRQDLHARDGGGADRLSQVRRLHPVSGPREAGPDPDDRDLRHLQRQVPGLPPFGDGERAHGPARLW